MSDPETRAELLRLARQVERVEAEVGGLKRECREQEARLQSKMDEQAERAREQEARLEAKLDEQTERLEQAIEACLPRSDFGMYRLITLGVGAAILIALIPGLATTLVPTLLKLVTK